jgi:hypothetical protein
VTALDGAPDEKDTHDNNAAADKPIKSTHNKNKKLSLTILEDEINLIHRSLSRLRPDLRNIVREEIKKVIRDEMVRQRGYQ